MSQRTFLGIDIGTSSLKVILIDSSGRVAVRASSSYATQRKGDQWAEQDPKDWLSALRKCVRVITQGDRDLIDAIAVAGHVPTLVLVDDAGEPVRPAMIWQDARSVAQASRLAEHFGDTTELLGTPLPWAPSQLPPKIAWVAENQPSIAARTRWILSPKDYLNLYLTGTVGTDAWTSKGICEVTQGHPAQAVLSACGWNADKVPSAAQPWASLGTLSEVAARELGLRAGITVAGGWTDAMASVLAVGGFERPTGVVLTGTSEIVGASSYSDRATEGLYLVPRTVAPLALTYGPTQSSGGSFDWIAAACGLSVGAALNLAATASGTVPVFVPYLDGERAPVWNPDVRGLYLGLSSSHGPAHLIRAVADGIAMSARHVLELAFAAVEERIAEVNVGGRGVTHPLWVEARRCALAVPLRLHDEPNLTALGAAMLAALAHGTTLSELHKLRAEPLTVTPSPDEVNRAQGRLATYLTASSLSIEWSTK